MSLLARPFPEFLVPAFDAEALHQIDASIAVIDPEGTLLWVNPAWGRFAQENGAGDAVGTWVSYFDGIAQPLRDFYQAVFANALATGEVYDQEYECSSPDTRRLFHFRALPVDRSGLILEHSLVAETAHEASSQAAAPARYLNGHGLLEQCSHCRRVRAQVTQAWEWVRDWVARPHANTSHVICPSCVGFYWGRRSARKS